MPALMSSNDLIGSSLKKSFGKKKNHDHLEEHITLSSNLILNHKVEYVAAISNQHNVLSKHLKAKYMVLGKTASVANSSVNNMTREEASSSAPEGCLPPPKIILHKWTDVELGWKRNVPVGAGMINLGNTCYLNSTLQALFHVPSFTNWILNEKKHKARCNQKTPDGAPQCTLCAVEMTLRTTHDKTGSAIKPSYVYRRLNAICKHLIHGRQEDAHEFMRYLMEAMDKSYLMSMNAMKLDARSKETSPINQIFGGYLRQEVKCLKCHYVSVTHQHFQDLSLDIARVSSLDEAFALFFRKETLDGSNVYKCDRCKQKVPATKQCFLERPPHVLCVQLKRFSGFGGKLNKPVQYSQNVNLTRFLHESQRSKLPITYKFTSLVNHLGSSQNCGHYTAVAMASNGNCYMFDDCSVRSVSINATQTSSAYILLFERSQPPAEISANYQLTSAAPAKLATPSGKPTPKLVMLPRPVPVVKPTIIGIDGMVKPSAATPLKNGNLPATKEREKITFNLNSKQETPEQNKPRLVINQKFKNGVASSVLTNGAKPVIVKKSEPVAAKAAVPDVKKENGLKSLVPYESDSDEDRKDSGKMDKAEVRATENKWKVTPATSETSSVAGSSTSDWLILEADGNTRWENVKRKLANFTGKIFKRAKSEERTSISEPSRSSKFSSDTESLSSPVPKKVKKEKLKTCEEVEETSRKQNEKNAEIEGLKQFQKEHNDKVKLSEKQVTAKAKESTPSSLKYDVCPKKDRNKVVSVKEEDKKPEEKPAELPAKIVGSAASSDDVVSQLKDMSHLGFGNQVSSWSGTKSKVDIEGETLRNESRKRTAEDLYNEELDVGKERKFKTRKQEYRSSDGNQNAFQSFQDYKRQKHENGYSANNSFSDWNSNRSQSKWTPNRSWSDNGRYNTSGGGFQRRKSWNNGGDRNGGYRSDRYNWNSNSKYRR